MGGARQGRRARSNIPHWRSAPPGGRRSENWFLCRCTGSGSRRRTGPDPVSLLEEQGASRVPELVPIRYGRMLVSPFTFYRGAAYLMASDLASAPRTGLSVQLCGDAHLSNFGVFAAPDRQLVFSVNDFDETLPGPFEWDVKRLVASFAVAGRDRGFDTKQRKSINQATARSYREAMLDLAQMKKLDVWYARLDVEEIDARLRSQVKSKKGQVKRFEKNVAKARSKDSMKAFNKLVQVVDGRPQLVGDPPLIVPIEDLLADVEYHQVDEAIHNLLRSYRRTLAGDHRHLLEGFRYVHAARKVVGVGSVGTRAWILLMLGNDDSDPLFLQAKEARGVGTGAFLGQEQISQPRTAGRRRSTAHAVCQRHHARLDPDRRDRRRVPGLLHPPTLGRQGIGGHRGHEPIRPVRLRRPLRLDACPGPRTLR